MILKQAHSEKNYLKSFVFNTDDSETLHQKVEKLQPKDVTVLMIEMPTHFLYTKLMIQKIESSNALEQS